ncbi:uncharacterized protein LOC144100191 isoform X2 [Amblyomma americanum]
MQVTDGSGKTPVRDPESFVKRGSENGSSAIPVTSTVRTYLDSCPSPLERHWTIVQAARVFCVRPRLDSRGLEARFLERQHDLLWMWWSSFSYFHLARE